MSKIFKKIAKIALPVVASMIPGVGPVLGSVIGGAASGLVGGGGLKDALTGAALGGLSSYGGSLFGNAGTTINWANAAPGYALGTSTVGGSGILGGLSSLGSLGSKLATGLGSMTQSAGGAASSGMSSLANLGANVYSGIQGTQAYKDMAKSQLDATNKAISTSQPWLSSGVAANTQLASLLGLSGDDNEDILAKLRATPGYQFRMQQGQDTLDTQHVDTGL